MCAITTIKTTTVQRPASELAANQTANETPAPFWRPHSLLANETEISTATWPPKTAKVESQSNNFGLLEATERVCDIKVSTAASHHVTPQTLPQGAQCQPQPSEDQLTLRQLAACNENHFPFWRIIISTSLCWIFWFIFYHLVVVVAAGGNQVFNIHVDFTQLRFCEFFCFYIFSKKNANLMEDLRFQLNKKCKNI